MRDTIPATDATTAAGPPAPGSRRLPVSVVIPCYRCADTIDRAVDSVAAQAVPPEELLLVDDASGDGTLDRLTAIRERLGPWVRVLRLAANGGPSAARNAGWEEATQPYLAFLDADDSWHPRKLAVQHDWMARHPEVPLTAHRYTRIDGTPRVDPLPAGWHARPIGFGRLLVSNPFPTRTVMLRRDLPHRFCPEKRRSEDYLLWLQVVRSEGPGWVLDVSLAYRYKAPFGDGGLTGDLWLMEKGELDTYRRIAPLVPGGRATVAGLGALSLVRHVARLARTARRRRSPAGRP